MYTKNQSINLIGIQHQLQFDFFTIVLIYLLCKRVLLGTAIFRSKLYVKVSCSPAIIFIDIGVLKNVHRFNVGDFWDLANFEKKANTTFWKKRKWKHYCSIVMFMTVNMWVSTIWFTLCAYTFLCLHKANIYLVTFDTE